MTTELPRGTAHIEIPTSAARTPVETEPGLTSDASPEEVAAVLKGIDELLAACRECNSNDRLQVLIIACIERGINTRGRIVGTGTHKGFNEKQIQRVVQTFTGVRWRRNRDQTYSVIV
jgi:hypothetical protein